MIYIATYREQLNSSYDLKEENPILQEFITQQIRKLTAIIEDKLTAYEPGPWADKTISEVEAEFTVLATLRDTLINLAYLNVAHGSSSGSLSAGINEKSYAHYISGAISRIKIENPDAFKKHGRLARLATTFNVEVKSKLEVFCEELIEDASKVVTNHTKTKLTATF